MSDLPSANELHARAGEAAKETRSTMIKLTTGSLGLLIFIATRDIQPALVSVEKGTLILSITFVVLSLAYAVWFGFAEAQWAYWWAVQLDPVHRDHKEGRECKEKWHARKSRAESAMLVIFVIAAAAMAIFIVLRVLRVGTTTGPG